MRALITQEGIRIYVSGTKYILIPTEDEADEYLQESQDNNIISTCLKDNIICKERSNLHGAEF